MSSFIWPCVVLLASSERVSTPESNHCSLLARSIQGAWMTNPSVAWLARERAHFYKHMHAKLLCDTRLEARVTHANETGSASSRQHSVILHSSASLQKPKSFSPPSPVIVMLMERRSGSHLFSHTVRRTHKPFSTYVSFFSLKKKTLIYTNFNIASGTWQMQWTKTHLQGQQVLFNPAEVCDLSVGSQCCKMWGYKRDKSPVSPRSISHP